MDTIKLNPCTQKARNFLRAYFTSRMDSLYSAYNEPSYYKKIAWNDILNEKNANRGRYLRITGYSCSKYSAAYLMDDTETGGEKVIYYTADYTYEIPLGNIDLNTLIDVEPAPGTPQLSAY